jgi:hypothetical protein
MKRFGITLAAVAVLLAPASVAQAAGRPRPTDVPPAHVVTQVAPNELQIYNDYVTPSLTYASQDAVVHYVVLGIDAPPLNDDDGDGVPDYVERAGAGADTAIAYYQRRGFASILTDQGGPDGRPDIYVSRFTPGRFGVAFPAADAQGGAFVVISNALDPSPERSLGSLYGTVAHELFHLVQFSYFRPTVYPAIATWALEGSAAAMEGRVFPELDDIVASLQLRRWFNAPQQSLTAQSYGSQLLWRYVDVQEPLVLPAFLARLEGVGHRGAGAVLATTYARVTHRPFAQAFGRFAAWVEGEHASDLTPLRRLAPRGRATGRVCPLAIHFLRLSRATRSVTLRFTAGRGETELTYEFESEYAGDPAAHRRLRARAEDGALVYTIPATLRHSERFELPTLVVANGDVSRSAAYSLVADT